MGIECTKCENTRGEKIYAKGEHSEEDKNFKEKNSLQGTFA